MHSYIRTPEALGEIVAAFRREPLVGADTEAASFHRYRDRIFLVQLSTRERTAVVDPLAIADLAPVGALLGDAAVDKGLHGADDHLRIRARYYGLRGAPIGGPR